MRPAAIVRLSWLAILLALTSVAPAEWQRIGVNHGLIDELFGDQFLGYERPPGFREVRGKLAIERFPGCSGAPAQVGPEGASIDAPGPDEEVFAFFVDLGDGPVASSDLLLYLAGGGACWDHATCVDSAVGPLPTYFPTFSENEYYLQFASNDSLPDGTPLYGAGGILTNLAARPENPYAGFSKVYIPYCTGDIHIGSSDTTYHPGEDSALPEWTIQHRGFDNLLVVLKWLERQQQNGLAIDALTVAGSSAGGYGALINYPVIREALGEGLDYSIIVDSANGVLTDGFLKTAFGSPVEPRDEEEPDERGVWGARKNVHEILQPVLDLEAKSLWLSAFRTIGWAYPDTRISQSTAAFDAVQALVLLFMQQVDDETYNPFEPPPEAEITRTALFEWSPKARMKMLTTAFRVPNFRYYLGAGAGHIHLLDPPTDVVDFPTTNYFEEDSARGVEYTQWLDDMLNNPRRFFRTDWRNLSCFPYCLQ